MDATAAQDPKLLAHYEGLVRKTAGRNAHKVEDDFEDICQFFRYKVWKALLSFDPAGLRVKPTSRKGLEEARDKYVFSCITNAVKDVLKKKQHNLLFIEDVAGPGSWSPEGDHAEFWGQRQHFEQRYMCLEDAFREVEDELPVVPSTLTRSERAVVLLLYLDFKPTEIALYTTLPRAEINAMTKTIRTKMADWDPADAALDEVSVPLAA